MQERVGVGLGLEGRSTLDTPQHSALRSPFHQVLPPHQAPQLFIIPPPPSYLDPLPKQDLNLREASRLLQEGLAATNVEQEERAWTAVIEKYKDVDAPWAADVVSEGARGGRRERGRGGGGRGGTGGKGECVDSGDGEVQGCGFTLGSGCSERGCGRGKGRPGRAWTEAIQKCKDVDALLTSSEAPLLQSPLPHPPC